MKEEKKNDSRFTFVVKDRIKKLRNEKKMTQEEVAATIPISREQYSNIENGKHRTDILVVEKLARLFDCPYDYLVGRTLYRNIADYEYMQNEIKDFEARLAAARENSDNIQYRLAYGPGNVITDIHVTCKDVSVEELVESIAKTPGGFERILEGLKRAPIMPDKI